MAVVGRTVLGGLVALVLATAGCTAQGQPQASTGSKGTVGDPTGWTEVSPRAVDLPSGRSLGGPTSPIRAGTPVLVNFWASYCGPCKDELPMLQRFTRTKKATVIGVSRDVTAAPATTELRKAGVRYRNRLDPQGSYLHSFREIPRALPNSVLIEHGKVTAVHIGPFVSWADLNSPFGS